MRVHKPMDAAPPFPPELAQDAAEGDADTNVALALAALDELAFGPEALAVAPGGGGGGGSGDLEGGEIEGEAKEEEEEEEEEEEGGGHEEPLEPLPEFEEAGEEDEEDFSPEFEAKTAADFAAASGIAAAEVALGLALVAGSGGSPKKPKGGGGGGDDDEDELAVAGGGGGGNDGGAAAAGGHQGAALPAAAGAVAAAAAAAAGAAAPPQSPEILAVNRGLYKLELRKAYATVTAKILAHPGARDNVLFQRGVIKANLSREKATIMRSCVPGGRQKLWGCKRRSKLTSKLVAAEAMGSEPFRVDKYTDATLGALSKGLSLSTVIFPLRATIESMVRSVAHAPGTFGYLDGTEVPAPGGCVPLAQTKLVLDGAAAAHAHWQNHPGRPYLEQWALRNGYKRPACFPFHYKVGEDATNLSTRRSADIIHFYGCTSQHALCNPHFVNVCALITKPPWLKGSIPTANMEWAENVYHQSIAHGTGMVEMLHWDRELLLVDTFPGCSLQPPPGEKWLYVISPYFCGFSGDLQSAYVLLGLSQNHSCPWCLVPKSEFNSDECNGKYSSRSDPYVQQKVAELRLKFKYGSAAAGEELRKWGYNPASKTAFDLIRDTGIKSFRVPHTTGLVSEFDSYGIDSLHVLRQGVIPRVIELTVTVVKSEGDYAALSRNFDRTAAKFFSDGVRVGESFRSGLDLSRKALRGNTYASMLRCILPAIDHRVLPNARLRTTLTTYIETVLFMDVISSTYATETDLEKLPAFLSRLVQADNVKMLGPFDRPKAKRGKAPVGKNFIFPKFHCLQEFPNNSRRIGCPINSSMGPLELANGGDKLLIAHCSRSAEKLYDQLAVLILRDRFFDYSLPFFLGEDAPLPFTVTPVPRCVPTKGLGLVPLASFIPYKDAIEAYFGVSPASLVEGGAQLCDSVSLYRVSERGGVWTHHTSLRHGDMSSMERVTSLVQISFFFYHQGEVFFSGYSFVSTLQPGEAKPFIFQEMRRRGDPVVASVRSLLGRAWTHPAPPGHRFCLMYSPLFERHRWS